MFRSETEDESEQLQSDADPSSSTCCRGEWSQSGFVPGADQKDLTNEDNSGKERETTPLTRRSTRKRSQPVSSSAAASSLNSPSTMYKLRSHRRKTYFAALPRNNSCKRPDKTFSTAGRRNEKRKCQAGKQSQAQGDDEDDERWCGVEEEDLEPPQPRFRPERDVGPQLNRTANYRPLDLFQLFFSTSVIDTLVKNTNAFGKKKYQNQKESWVQVTSADMYSFISLVLYMGIAPLKTFKDFWRGSKLFSLPFPASVMPCRRFLAISRSLHMNDPVVEAANEQKKGTTAYDRLCKIKPLYQQILEACHTFFHPYQHISIDERMVATKARIGLKQYIKNKPTRWGFKLYVLADSVCGYTLNFFVYGGKEYEPTGKGLAYDAVMRLLDIPFLGKGYKLYVDSFYTSPALFLHLLGKKIWACGTVRSNITGFPKTKNNLMTKSTKRGTIRWIRKGKLLFVKWLDTREVTMCTTIHKAYNNDLAKRRVKNTEGEWTVKQVPIPGCIKDYNRHMGGVDLSDALIGYYNVLHKTQKWYKTLFYHFVDIATVNAFILHKEMCKLHNMPAVTQKAFREQLILSLAEIGSVPRRSPQQNFMVPASPFKATPITSTAAGSADESTATPSEVPALGHLPSYFVEQMTNVAPRNRATAGRRSCVVCKRKSPVYCSTCQKTLCFTTSRNCYSQWHRCNRICI